MKNGGLPFLPTIHLLVAKAKFAQAREWDNKVVWGDEFK